MFSALLLIVIVLGSTAFYQYRHVTLTSAELKQGKHHFSVRWMGFFPTYNASYPDYYVAINDLAGNVLTMNIALQITNQESQGYYFKTTSAGSEPTGWTLQPLDLGFIDKDATRQFVYVANRTNPVSIAQGILTETITLSVQAYNDQGETSLYSEDNVPVVFHLIDRLSLKTLEVNNFDDGTFQGWSGYVPPTPPCSQYYPTIVHDVYKSYPYSMSVIFNCVGKYLWFQKSFHVPSNYTSAFLIFSVRVQSQLGMSVYINGTVYFVADSVPPEEDWYQYTIPLQPGVTSTVQIYAQLGNIPNGYGWLDDVYLVAA